MTYARRNNLIVTISPTPYAKPLLLDLVALSVVRVNVAASRLSLVATGGAGAPYTYTIASGSLPTGLSLNASTGAITGTPTVQGVSTFIAEVQDSASNTFQHGFSINVVSGLVGAPGGTQPPPGRRDTPYTFQFLVYYNQNPSGITYAVTSGSLPGGLSMSSAGLITGTPNGSAVGTTYFTVTATLSGTGTLAIPCALTIYDRIQAGTVTLPNALRNMTKGVPVSASLVFAGVGKSKAAGFVFSIAAGALPSGLAMSSRGLVSGTPDAVTGPAYTQPTIRVTDPSTLAYNDFSLSDPNTFNVATRLKSGAPGNVVTMDETGSPAAALDLSNLFFGSGTDGDFVLDGTNTYGGIFFKSGNNYAPLRHISASNITVTAPGVLLHGPVTIDVADTFDISGCPARSVIPASGLDASGATSGSQAIGFELGGTQQGSNGSAGTNTTAPSTPATPTSTDNAVPASAYAGGNGGSSGSGAGGTGGNPGPKSGTLLGWPRQNVFDPMATPVGGALNGGVPGGAGAGGRGTIGAVGGTGGGAGAGAPSARMRCRRFKTDASTAASAIDFSGGNGGNGTNGGTNAGGGGGGSGGVGGRYQMIFAERIGDPVTDLIDVSGGDGGLKGNGNGTGAAGVDGKGADSGVVEVFDVSSGAFYYQGPVAASGGRTGASNKLTI